MGHQEVAPINKKINDQIPLPENMNLPVGDRFYSEEVLISHDYFYHRQARTRSQEVSWPRPISSQASQFLPQHRGEDLGT